MSYNFESLDDEDFQRLAQALVLAEFPRAQMLPTGQPDGGRDSFTWEASGGSVSLDTVFQVKFSKHPALRTEREALSAMLRTEAGKINSLKERGAKRYVFITNVAGTSHLDVGSIDSLNNLSSQLVDIEFACWWRSDIEARLQLKPELIWSFPAIARGTDVLSLLHYEGGEDTKRRNRAIKSVVATQHANEDEVRFKEIDLRYPISEIYVDTPVSGRDDDQHGDQLIGDCPIPSKQPATKVFLASCAQPGHVRILLEGAPGQGKSTVTQFLCQLNRLQFLDKYQLLLRLSSKWRPTGIRVPIRADLRDYATWLAGSSPFSTHRGEQHNADTSLDAFLAALVKHVSGGMEFDVNDLHAVFNKTRLLLVLDGFDEVADAGLRIKMAEEINRCADRLEQTCESIHLIVTSRPSALLSTPVFVEPFWVSLVLDNLTSELAISYTEKWANVKNLSRSDKDDLIRILTTKLTETHIAELSKNPMQLSILATLISNQGESLPSKRTALYTDYVRLFFDRECHKSAVVKENRALLVMLHEYLAYIMHADSERDDSNTQKRQGTLTLSEVKAHMSEFLTSLGHQPDMLDGLFTAMKERVVALVQNVQGTYEFQVQPLREYFAAQHLYKTAATGPGEMRGSRPQRYAGMMRNGFWSNVTRFYAGSYNAGELPSLVDETIAAVEHTDLAKTNFATILFVSYLVDYVFENQPRLVQRAVEFMSSGERIDALLSLGVMSSPDSTVRLPAKSGAPVLANILCTFVDFTDNDRAAAALRVIKDNLPLDDKIEFLEQHWDTPNFDAIGSAWLLGLIQDASPEFLRRLTQVDPTRMTSYLLYSRRSSLIREFGLERELLSVVLDSGEDSPFYHLRGVSLDIHAVATSLSYSMIRNMERVDPTWTLGEFSHKYYLAHSGQVLTDESALVGSVIEEKAAMEARILLDTRIGPEGECVSQWLTTLSSLLNAYGERAGIFSAACHLARHIESSSLECAVPGILVDWVDGYHHRANSDWWSVSFEGATLEQKARLAKLYFAYGVPNRTGRLNSNIAHVFESLSEEDRGALLSLSMVIQDEADAEQSLKVSSEASGLRHVLHAISSATPRAARANLVKANLENFQSGDEALLNFALEAMLEAAFDGEDVWDLVDALARSARKAQVSVYTYSMWHQHSLMPMDLAQKVCSAPDEYPLSIVRLSDQRLRADASAKAPKVSVLATQQMWFEPSTVQ